MDNNSIFGFSELIISFAVGVLSSSLVAWLFHFKQRREDEESQRALIIYLYSLFKQGKESRSIIANVENKIDSILLEIPEINKSSYIIEQFQKTNAVLKKDFTFSKRSNYLEDVLKYKIYADKWSEISQKSLNLKLLSETGEITIGNILSLHKSIFPEGYVWAGNLRTQMVKLMGSAIVSGRSVSPLVSSITIEVVDPNNIISSINRLVKNWNENIKNIINYDVDEKCEEIAHFHQQFLLIHPFLDGNGRVAALIANEQASFLFGQEIKFDFRINSEQYYSALRLADLRKIDTLRDLIKNNIVRQLNN
jgi:fido (protein-threonine AMPylation protein)